MDSTPPELTKLIVAWALVGATAATLLMLGLARLGSGHISPRKLFYLLLALVVLGACAFLFGRFQLNPQLAGDKVRWPLRVQLGQAQQQAATLQKENLSLKIAYERATGRKIYVGKGRNFSERIARLNKQMKAAGPERVAAIYDAAFAMQKRFGFAFLPAGADVSARAKFVSDRINSLNVTKRKEDFEPLGLWEGLFADLPTKEHPPADTPEK